MGYMISGGSRGSLHRTLTAALLVSAAACTALAAGSARAAAPSSTPSVVVRYGDLDVATPDGAAKLYRRISSAVHRVCPETDSRRLEDKMATWSCRRQALDRAVESVNSPQVASIVKHPRLAAASSKVSSLR
jgi:UrcA family protein